MRGLEASEDKIAHAVDHWLDRIIEGFIIEFMVDTLVSYSKVEQRFLKGLRGKYIKYLNTWIKILLCEKWFMRINLCLGLHKVGGSTEMKVAQK